uniref:Uncharacterized protein n=1 Tax=Neolamprologus brichardi TaxID=32507 RepID=A0A3Q4MJP0_NEOBR
VPTIISAFQGKLATSCGSDGHSMALTETGEVFSWGDGDFGKLGHGNSERQRRPKQIEVVPSLEGLFIEDIAVGCEHVLAMSSTGDVYAWGSNNEGQVIGNSGTDTYGVTLHTL